MWCQSFFLMIPINTFGASPSTERARIAAATKLSAEDSQACISPIWQAYEYSFSQRKMFFKSSGLMSQRFGVSSSRFVKTPDEFEAVLRVFWFLNSLEDFRSLIGGAILVQFLIGGGVISNTC